MAAQLSHMVEGVPERFVPAEMRGELVEAEHMARYWWAGALCEGQRVLDAGCGTGYGAALLKRAGAAEVVAVDVAESVVEVAGNLAPDGVRCEVADLRGLPYADGSFDVVVCFEVIEHVEEQDRVLDELARVLRSDGLLVISSPNRDRYVPGNPHHRHEYVPSELQAALASRFATVRMFTQHAMLASVIGSSEERPGEAHVERLVEPREEDELYTLAIAGGRVPESGPPVVALTQFFEPRQWLEHYHQQDRILHEQAQALSELQQLRRDRRQALDLLAEREQELAELPALRERVAQSTAALLPLEQRVATLTGRVGELAHAEDVARAMQASLSWRITRPLRAIKRLTGSLQR